MNCLSSLVHLMNESMHACVNELPVVLGPSCRNFVSSAFALQRDDADKCAVAGPLRSVEVAALPEGRSTVHNYFAEDWSGAANHQIFPEMTAQASSPDAAIVEETSPCDKDFPVGDGIRMPTSRRRQQLTCSTTHKQSNKEQHNCVLT